MDKQLLEYFNKNGYCLVEDGLPEDLLHRWRTLADKIEKHAVEEHIKGEQVHGAAVIKDKVGPRLMRYDDIFSQDHDLVLQTLATPALLEIAKKMVGRGCVPVQMDILYKQQHPHPVIKWHQGAQHSRDYPYLNVGIYLDDAPAGDGCLRYVPDTQHHILDIERLSKQYGWEIPGVVEQPARSGDILVQDMMILHGSQPKRSEGVRRTIYIEFRPWQSITESQCQSDGWAMLRKHWMALVLEQDSKQIWPQEWRDDYPTPASADTLFKTILEKREPPQPAVWGVFPVTAKDYPVPEDMLDW